VTVVAASTANPHKLRQIAEFGAEVRLDGEDIEDARMLRARSRRRKAPTWLRTAWTWRPARAPPRSGSSLSETIQNSMSWSWPHYEH
jgi:hypothetical protein